MDQSPNFGPELMNYILQFVAVLVKILYLQQCMFCICNCAVFVFVFVIFRAVQWVLMISPRVNVWVTTIIWRYNIHCSTSTCVIKKRKKEKKRDNVSVDFLLSVVYRTTSTQYISLFNQFFDYITKGNNIYSKKQKSKTKKSKFEGTQYFLSIGCTHIKATYSQKDLW